MNVGHHRISARTRISIVVDGVELDEDLLKVLLLVDITGSINQAAKSLGIPYSRVWERIARAEKAIGAKIIDAKRGGSYGGGSKLTSLGKKILETYLSEVRSRIERGYEGGKGCTFTYLYAGSHDPLIERVLKKLDRELKRRYAWVGSLKGLSLFIAGQCAVTGIHILDVDTEEYNDPIIRKFMLEDLAEIKNLFLRRQGFIARSERDYEGIVDGLIGGELRFVNRCWGSGTRMLVDVVLRKEALRRGLEPRSVTKTIRGYEWEVSTHNEVANAVKSGVADVGMGIEYVARITGLSFVPVRVEKFDILVRWDVLNDSEVKHFLEELDREIAKSVSSMPGYIAVP